MVFKTALKSENINLTNLSASKYFFINKEYHYNPENKVNILLFIFFKREGDHETLILKFMKTKLVTFKSV